MAWWDIFRIGNTAEKAIDVVGKWGDWVARGIDAAVFTEEEKKQMAKDIFELEIRLREKMYDENSERSVSRRVIAVMFLFPFLLAVIAYPIVGIWWEGIAERIFFVINVLDQIIMAIVIFFFGSQGVARGLEAWKAQIPRKPCDPGELRVG